MSAFANSLLRHTGYQDFRFVAAYEDQVERMVGFSYGYRIKPGQWWHDQVARALDPEVAEDWLKKSFQLVELAVAPSFQGQGFGGQLHDRLIAGLPHPRAVLSTISRNTVAYHLYRIRGWLNLLENFQFAGVVRPYRIMGLDLRAMEKEKVGLFPGT